MITHKIITNDGYVVCECESLKEAAQCKAELIAIDKEDRTYEKGFYKIVRAWVEDLLEKFDCGFQDSTGMVYMEYKDYKETKDIINAYVYRHRGTV